MTSKSCKDLWKIYAKSKQAAEQSVNKLPSQKQEALRYNRKHVRCISRTLHDPDCFPQL